MIHLNPRACDGPYITLFQRDLLLAYQEIDPGVADVIFKYFSDHASQWMSPETVALSLSSNSPPLSLDAVTISTSLPVVVDASAQLKSRSARRKTSLISKAKQGLALCALMYLHLCGRQLTTTIIRLRDKSASSGT